jgi:hypothetical protein
MEDPESQMYVTRMRFLKKFYFPKWSYEFAKEKRIA